MPKSKRSRAPRWTQAEARAVVEDLRRSGLSVSQFAAEHGLAVERLYRWRQRLQSGKTSAPRSPRFAEVTVRPSAPPAAIEIELPGSVAVRISGGTRVDDAIAILSRLPVR
jgi:transposase-like protein